LLTLRSSSSAARANADGPSLWAEFLLFTEASRQVQASYPTAVRSPPSCRSRASVPCKGRERSVARSAAANPLARSAHVATVFPRSARPGRLPSRLESVSEPSTTLKKKDVKRTWRAKRPFHRRIRLPRPPHQNLPTCTHLSKWRDPESNRGHHDFQGRPAWPGSCGKACKSGYPGRVRSAVIPVDSRSCPWVKDVAA